MRRVEILNEERVGIKNGWYEVREEEKDSGDEG